MRPDEENMQYEIERDLAALAEDLAVSAPPAALDRARAAARRALDECWLAAHPGPVPSAKAMERVKAHVRAELNVAHSRSRNGMVLLTHGREGRAGRWSRTLGGLAAAAMIALSLGVIRYGGLIRSSSQPGELPLTASLDLFIATAEELFVEDPFYAAMSIELDSLEYSISQWDLESEGESEQPEPAGRTHAPLSEPALPAAHAHRGGSPEGAVG
jgi:hypothetical protein